MAGGAAVGLVGFYIAHSLTGAQVNPTPQQQQQGQYIYWILLASAAFVAFKIGGLGAVAIGGLAGFVLVTANGVH